MRGFQPIREGKPEDWAAMFRQREFKNFIALRADGERDRVRELVFQQYLYLILSYGRVPYPLWLGSGLSLFYGNAYVSKTHAEVGKMHERHRRELGEFRALPLQEGVEVVKKALETNQGNVYLLFILGQLYARQENYSAARAVYEHLIARKLDAEMVADVRRQLDWVIAKMGAP